MKIERVEVRSVGPPTEQFTWSDDLPAQYVTNTVLRLYTDDGIEAAAGVWNATSYGYEKYAAEVIRHIAPILIGRDPLQREALWHDIRPRVFPVPPQALAAIDVALWDLAGRVAGLPIYRLLGARRERIRSSASTPMLADVPAYVKFVEDLRGLHGGQVSHLVRPGEGPGAVPVDRQAVRHGRHRLHAGRREQLRPGQRPAGGQGDRRPRVHERPYPKEVAVTEEQMARVNLSPHGFHGDWNGTIRPASTQ